MDQRNQDGALPESTLRPHACRCVRAWLVPFRGYQKTSDENARYNEVYPHVKKEIDIRSIIQSEGLGQLFYYY